MKNFFATLFFALLLLPALAFSQNTVSSKIRTVTTTLVIETSAYATGDLVGGKQTISGAGACNSAVGPLGLCAGIIHTVQIIDLDAEAEDYDIVIFDENPINTTFTENSALDIADADLAKVACVLQVTTDVAFADNGVSFINGANCVFNAQKTTGTLYAAMVYRGAGVTYTSTADLKVRYGILQD